MKNKIIRRGAFETNSSSCNSLVIGETFPLSRDIPVEILPNRDGISILNLREIGSVWTENGESSTSLEKLLYYITTKVLCKSWNVETRELKEDSLKDNPHYTLLKHVIMEATKATDFRLLTKDQEDEIDPETFDTMSVDHDSWDLLDDISNDPISLYNYLFNPLCRIDFDYNG